MSSSIQQQSPVKGAVYSLFGLTQFYFANSLFSKLSIPYIQYWYFIMIRTLICTLICIYTMNKKGISPHVSSTRDFILLSIRSITGVCTGMTASWAATKIQISEVAVTGMTLPFFQVIADYYILKNVSYSKRELLTIVFGFMGVLIFIKPELLSPLFQPKPPVISEYYQYYTGTDRLFVISLQLFWSCICAFGNTIYKKLQHINAAQYTYNGGLIGFLISSFLCSAIGVNGTIHIYGVILAILSGISFYSAIYLLSVANLIGKLAINQQMVNANILYSFALEIFFFKEEILLSSVVGATIVICSISLVFTAKSK